MKSPRRIAQTNRIVEQFQKLEPEQRRIVMEVTRRMVAGVPFDVALEAVTGHSEIPATWKS